MTRVKFFSILLVFTLLIPGTLVWGQPLQVVTEELAPYNYTEDGKIAGFCTEIVEAVLQRAGIEYTIKSHPWEKSYQLAQTQPNTMIYSIGRNVDREPLFKWGGVMVQLDVYFFKLKNRVDIRIKTLADAKKYKIGVVKDDFRMQFLAKEGVDEQFVVVDTDRQNVLNLFAHTIDLTPLDLLTAYHLARQEGYSFANDMEKTLYIKDVSVELYFAFSKQTPDEIVQKCTAALAAIKDDGTYEKIKSSYKIFYLPVINVEF